MKIAYSYHSHRHIFVIFQTLCLSLLSLWLRYLCIPEITVHHFKEITSYSNLSWSTSKFLVKLSFLTAREKESMQKKEIRVCRGKRDHNIKTSEIKQEKSHTFSYTDLTITYIWKYIVFVFYIKYTHHPPYRKNTNTWKM